MRHAKSDWEAAYSTDHDRPLNDRGVRSAQIMGRVLAARDLAPHVILSSDAVRARTTAELARDAGVWDSSLFLEPRFYGGTTSDVLDAVSKSPAVSRVMVVGHQPRWSILVDHLTGADVDMKTAAVAVVALPIANWAEADHATGSLVEVLYPRDFFGSQFDR